MASSASNIVCGKLTNDTNGIGYELLEHHVRQIMGFTTMLLAASLLLTYYVADGVHIPFTLSADNNVVVKARLNGTDVLNLMLHTAISDVRLTEDAVRHSPNIRWTTASEVKSWGGQATSRISVGNRLQIGPLQQAGVTVWEDVYSGVGTDGKFGLDFFDGNVVAINFDHRRITVYNRLPSAAAKYQRLKLEGAHGDFFVEATCVIAGKAYRNRFLLHSGYSGGILLDDEFVARSGIEGNIHIAEESVLKDSFGNSIKVRKGVLPQLNLGELKLNDVKTGFFSGGMGRQKISVLGIEVLMKFNMIFDVKNHSLYVSPRDTRG